MMSRWLLGCALLTAACGNDERSEAPLDTGVDSNETGPDASTVDAAIAHPPVTVDAGRDAEANVLDAAGGKNDGAVADSGSPSACPAAHQRTFVDVPAGALSPDLTHWTCD